MSVNSCIVATYAKHSLAEKDFRDLLQMGLEPTKLALLSGGEHGIEGGFSTLDAAMCSCIPPEDIVAFETELKAGRLVLVANGTAEEIEQAKRLLDEAHPTSWDERADSTVYYGCAM
jgi:hypothetical protein